MKATWQDMSLTDLSGRKWKPSYKEKKTSLWTTLVATMIVCAPFFIFLGPVVALLVIIALRLIPARRR